MTLELLLRALVHLREQEPPEKSNNNPWTPASLIMKRKNAFCCGKPNLSGVIGQDIISLARTGGPHYDGSVVRRKEDDFHEPFMIAFAQCDEKARACVGNDRSSSQNGSFGGDDSSDRGFQWDYYFGLLYINGAHFCEPDEIYEVAAR